MEKAKKTQNIIQAYLIVDFWPASADIVYPIFYGLLAEVCHFHFLK